MVIIFADSTVGRSILFWLENLGCSIEHGPDFFSWTPGVGWRNQVAEYALYRLSGDTVRRAG